MEQMISEYWWLWLIALLIGIAVAWVVFAAGRRTTVERDESGDVLDEGAAPARRNQALIDASPSGVALPEAAVGTVPPATPMGVTGAGTAVAAAALASRQDREAAPLPDDAGPEPDPAPATAPAADPVDDATPVTEAAPLAPKSAVPDDLTTDGDDLTQIKGVGPKLAARLNTLGITRYAQIAAWDDAERARIDAQLDRFAGRPERDEWILQARLLEAGDTDGFAERFGNL